MLGAYTVDSIKVDWLSVGRVCLKYSFLLNVMSYLTHGKPFGTSLVMEHMHITSFASQNNWSKLSRWRFSLYNRIFLESGLFSFVVFHTDSTGEFSILKLSSRCFLESNTWTYDHILFCQMCRYENTSCVFV